MNLFNGDIQVLLYVSENLFDACRSFYNALLGAAPYYQWDESALDRGAKFHAGTGTICILCQEHVCSIKSGTTAISLETGDIGAIYKKISNISRNNKTYSDVITRPYGTRCFQIQDPAGNIINIYQKK